MGLLDLIFPKYCVNCKKYGDYLCPNCFSRLSFDTRNICLACGKDSLEGLTHSSCKGKYTPEGSFTAVTSNSITKKLVYHFKSRPYLYNLASFLTDLMYESLIQNEVFINVLKRNPVLVPIPLSSLQLNKRGYNQAQILSKNLAKKLNLPSIDLLSRVKETGPQKGLSKDERSENVKDAFALRNKHEVRNANLILVDDVLTSGATMVEAARVLRSAGVRSVWVLALTIEDLPKKKP